MKTREPKEMNVVFSVTFELSDFRQVTSVCHLINDSVT